MASPPKRSDPADLPLPPLELADRVGAVSGPNESLEPFLAFGHGVHLLIESVLPETWFWEGRRVLDFGCGAGRVLRHFSPESASAQFVGCDIDAPSIAWLREHLCPPFQAFVNAETPPLAQPTASFDLVYAVSVFTHITDEWSGWLLDLHRLLKEDGLLVASVLGGGMSEEIAQEPWDPDRIGMNVLLRSRPWTEGGPNVLISEWWLRAHWGRIFEVLDYQEFGGGQDLVLLRRRPVHASREDLERPEPGEARELEFLRHNVRQLHRESAGLREAAGLRVAEGWARAGEAAEAQAELKGTRIKLARARARLVSLTGSASRRLTALLRRARAGLRNPDEG